MLFELLKMSPALFLTVVGKEIFALIGIVTVYGYGLAATSKTFRCKVEVPEPLGAIDVLFEVKLTSIPLFSMLLLA